MIATSPATAPPTPARPWRSWLRLLLLGDAVAAGLAIALFPLYGIGQIGIDVPVWEHWEFIPILGQSYAGGPWLRSIFQPFFGHMLAVPMLLFIGASRLNGWSPMLEMYWGWVLVAATALLLTRWVRALRLPLPLKVLFFLCLALLVFGLRAGELIFNGLNSSVFLAYFLVVATLELGKEPNASWPRFLASAATALLATWSWGAGLLLWPVGALLVLHHRRSLWSRLAVWSAVGLVAISPFVLFKAGAVVGDQPHQLARMPQWTLNLLSTPFSLEARTVPALLLLLLALAAVWVLGRAALRARAIAPEVLPWAGLLAHGLLTILLVLYTRSVNADFSPIHSRYAYVAVFPLVGLLCLGLLAVRESTQQAAPWLRKTAWAASAAVLLLVGGRVALMSHEMYTLLIAWQPLRAALDAFMKRAPEYATEGQFLTVVQTRTHLLKPGLETLQRWHLGPFRRTPAAPLPPVAQWVAQAAQAEDVELKVGYVGQMGDDHLDVQGWAVDRQGLRSAAFVVAAVQGTVLEQALTGMASATVPPGTDPWHNTYGWRLIIPADKLRALAAPSQLELVALSEDGRAHRIPLPLPEGLRLAAGSP